MSSISLTHRSARLPECKPVRFFSNLDLFKLFVPLVIEQCLVLVVGLADSVMVASVGEEAVSGVSLVDFIMALLISLFASLATGGAVIAGQYMGRGKMRRARDSADQMLRFVTITSLVIMAILYLSRTLILDNLFGHITSGVRSHAETYLLIVASSVPFLGAYGACAAIFRTMGNSKLPMKLSLLAGVLNVIGNALMLFVFNYGTAGVAVSTVFARIVVTVMIIALLLSSNAPLRIRRTFTPYMRWTTIKKVLAIGIPYGLENGMFYSGRIIILSLIATFGTAAIASNAVATAIAVFEVLPGMSIGLGLTVVIARCIGAGDYEQARYYNKKVLAIVYITHIIVNAAIVLLLPSIIGIYHLSTEATELTTKLLLLHAVLAITIWPLAYTLPVTFRASADAKFPMYIGITTMCICRIALAYVIGGYLEMGVLGTWIAMFLDWILKGGCFVWRYFSKKWVQFKAI